MISFYGQLGLLVGDVMVAILTSGFRIRQTLHQIVVIGVGSQVVVTITGAFTGAVLAAQTYFKFSELGLEAATGPVVSIAMCRELGPVLAALMVAGRMGSAMSAEIGTMRVTEQIDALRAMGTDPVEYLVIPRLAAILISMPILTAEAIWCGILSSQFLTVDLFGIPEPWYTEQLLSHTRSSDVIAGLVKSVLFGFLIVIASCHRGLSAKDGAMGVGQATTRAVVDSALAILVVNFFLSLLLERWFPTHLVDF